MRIPIENKKIERLKINCTDSGKVIDAELFDVRADSITVILPGFNKLTLYKVKNKPNFYLANQFGMEFYTTYKR